MNKLNEGKLNTLLLVVLWGTIIRITFGAIVGPRERDYRVVHTRDGRYAAQSAWPSCVFWVTTTVGTLEEARARVTWERSFVKKHVWTIGGGGVVD